LKPRRALRLALALLVAFTLIYVTNNAPGYLGPLEALFATDEELFVGISLILISLVLLRSGGYLRQAQSRGRFSLIEIAEAGVLVLAVTAFFGLGLSPFNLCIGGGGGFVCYADSGRFFSGLLDLVCIVVAEELFFRAYLINELNRVLNFGAGAVIVSSLIYAFFHLPVLQILGLGSVSVSGLLQILIGAFSLSACYWYTGRNLAASALLHAYWDGVGALLLIPNYGLYGEYLLILGQLSLPAAVLIISHRLGPSLANRLLRPAGVTETMSSAGDPKVGLANLAAPSAMQPDSGEEKKHTREENGRPRGQLAEGERQG